MPEQLPHLPSRLRASLAKGLRGPRHRIRCAAGSGSCCYDDADRIDSWGAGLELEAEGCCAPLLPWVRSWWVPTGGRELAQEPLVLALDPRHGDLNSNTVALGEKWHRTRRREPTRVGCHWLALALAT